MYACLPRIAENTWRNFPPQQKAKEKKREKQQHPLSLHNNQGTLNYNTRLPKGDSKPGISLIADVSYDCKCDCTGSVTAPAILAAEWLINVTHNTTSSVYYSAVDPLTLHTQIFAAQLEASTHIAAWKNTPAEP